MTWTVREALDGAEATKPNPRCLPAHLAVTMKVIIVGNGGVGKSSLIARFCKGVFTESHKKTIGVDFLEREHSIEGLGGERVRMMIWDTAGQEEFDALSRQYYRGASACILAFSTTDRASFDALPSWKDKVESECGTSIAMCIVQNKVDLAAEAAMTPCAILLPPGPPLSLRRRRPC